MSSRIFIKICELEDYIKSLNRGIEKYQDEKRSIELDIKGMSTELNKRKSELKRRVVVEAQDKVNSAQRALDLLIGKKVGPPKKAPVICNKKCPSGYMPPCSYPRGHSGGCEGQYDADRITRRGA